MSRHLHDLREPRGYPLFPCETGNTHDEDGDGKVNDGCPQVHGTAETGAQCDNNISDDLEDSDVNDGCPVFGDQSEAVRMPGACSAFDEGGCILGQNPATPGVFEATTLAVSLRDADGDGIENELDVCALDANPGWDPRAPGSDDFDFDGLPDTCDPNSSVSSPSSPQTCAAGNTGPDEDQDCLSNRQDNCPLVNQLADPGAPPGRNNLPNLSDQDNDGLGDACDPNPNQPETEGVPAFVCLKFGLDVGGAQESVATYDPERSLNCATSPTTDGSTPGPTSGPEPTLTPTPTPTLTVAPTPTAAPTLTATPTSTALGANETPVGLPATGAPFDSGGSWVGWILLLGGAAVGAGATLLALGGRRSALMRRMFRG